MEEGITRKERRRRRAEKTADDEIQKIIENLEPRATQSCENVAPRPADNVLHSKSDFHISTPENSEPLTYNVDVTTDDSDRGTYNLPEARSRPMPAPRKRKSLLAQEEKVSSDTDKDVAEIEADEAKGKWEAEVRRSKGLEASAVAPTPKPRKTRASFEAKEFSSPREAGRGEGKSKSEECLAGKEGSAGVRNAKSDSEIDLKDSVAPDSKELPLLADLREENSSAKKKEKKKTRVIVAEFLERKKKKKEKSRKIFSSVMKLDAGKLPKMSSVWREKKAEESERKTDFPTDSFQYPKSADNGNIYVQSKNGFRLVGREEVLNSGSLVSEDTGNAGMTEGSTVKTAILYQRYWSKFMIFFHGVLAGFALGHALIVMGTMLLHNYDPTKFIPFYSCLSLKIHFIFYILTTFCIVSCFDRIDVGHMNRKHWQIAWKIPSMWLIVSFYLMSFGLTFANQKTEASFDAYLTANETEDKIWASGSPSDLQVILISWYHVSWARDVLVVLAWLVISLTDFSDFLSSHLANMRKYANSKIDDPRHQISSGDAQYL